jgi:arylsulfatase A-like enzyme
MTKKSYAGEEWNVQGGVRPVHAYSTDHIARKAVAFLERSEASDDRPWFMVLAPQAPHRPFTEAMRHAHASLLRWRRKSPAMRERDRSDKPPYVRGRAAAQSRHRRVRKKQLRTLMAADELTQRVFVSLRKLSESANTLAFFLSDNGLMWGEHGLARKRHAYTDSITIPMFARWPGTISARALDDRLAGVLDVAPTILDAAGLERTNQPHGRALGPGRKQEAAHATRVLVGIPRPELGLDAHQALPVRRVLRESGQGDLPRILRA